MGQFGGTSAAPASRPELAKAPTGIRGFDEVTHGGLPAGRPTLVCGGAGCGKTLFALEFLVHAALDRGEAGVFVAFEETRDELVANLAPMGFDLARLEAEKRLVIDRIDIARQDIAEAGSYDLSGLFLRLGLAIDTVDAKRVVIDTIEVLFGVFSDAATVRAELRRLLGWLKQRGVTVVITGEQGDANRLTRHGIEEYVSDCVVVLDHRVEEEQSTRRLRVAKFRGTVHGTNEYPFLIGSSGLTVLPITSLGLDHPVSSTRVSTGVPGIDAMLGGGVFEGSTVLMSGTAGSGKTILAAHFVEAACRRGEKALFFAFEESQSQIVRNMQSVGIDLSAPVADGLVLFDCQRPTSLGLEVHLATMQEFVDRFRPKVVVVDAISNLLPAGSPLQVSSMLTREVDFLKSRGITAMITSLDGLSGTDLSAPTQHVTSLADAWLLARTERDGRRRNRTLEIVKARGTAHSTDVRPFQISDRGITIDEPRVPTTDGPRMAPGSG